MKIVLALVCIYTCTYVIATEPRGPSQLQKGDNLIFVHIPKTAGTLTLTSTLTPNPDPLNPKPIMRNLNPNP